MHELMTNSLGEMHLSSWMVKRVIYLHQHRSVHDIHRHDVCGQSFNVVTPFGTTTTSLKNLEGCVQNERKVVDLLTDILVHGTLLCDSIYCLIMFELMLLIFIFVYSGCLACSSAQQYVTA